MSQFRLKIHFFCLALCWESCGFLRLYANALPSNLPTLENNSPKTNEVISKKNIGILKNDQSKPNNNSGKLNASARTKTINNRPQNIQKRPINNPSHNKASDADQKPKNAGEVGNNLLDGTQEILSETVQDLYALVDSPALRHALTAGTYAANSAVTNAMDALFYSLLDRTWPVAKSQFTALESGIERRLTRLPDKSILVIDRMMIGPRMSRDLIPPSPMGIKTSVASGAYFYEFYLSSDAERINQTNRLLQNNFSAMNWFGLLPFLTRLLPPSFDPNELYNPLRVFSVPFKVPLNKSHLQKMEENSIRSYSIKGSISFPLTHSWLIKKLPEFASRTGLDAGIPITAYADVEARVAVHKHSHNIFKISLSDIKVEGANIGIEIGKVFYALGLSAGKFSWRGVPVGIFPFKMSFDTSLFQDQSIIREINIEEPLSDSVLAEALTGNFKQLDLVCKKCIKIESFRSGSNSKKSAGFSAFLFDSKNDTTMETSDHNIKTGSKDLAYRESRSDSTSVSWDIMNGAAISNQSFAWSSPTIKSQEKSLIWTRSSLTVPSIDEENFSEIEKTLALLGFHPVNNLKSAPPQELITTRASQSLKKMSQLPGILSSQKLFQGPEITGDLDILFDLYTNENAIQRLAQIPAEAIIQHLKELHNLRPKFFDEGICGKGVLEKIGASKGLDLCSVGDKDRDELADIQQTLLKNISSDQAKLSQSRMINKIGSLGFIYLILQTQSEKDFRLLINTHCTPERKSTSPKKDNCQNLNQPIRSLGHLPLEHFSWWKPDQTEKQDILSTKVENLDILKITPSQYKEDLQDNVQDFFDINLKEGLKGKVFVYIRIESKGDMDLTRSFLFEDVFETDLGFIDSHTISVPRIFLSKSSSRITTYKVGQLRFKISISRDGKNWSKMLTIDGSD